MIWVVLHSLNKIVKPDSNIDNNQINKAIIPSEYYSMLKNYYQGMIDKQNEKNYFNPNLAPMKFSQLILFYLYRYFI
jgi:hypothetical protein